jgi:hypothetical protein
VGIAIIGNAYILHTAKTGIVAVKKEKYHNITIFLP